MIIKLIVKIVATLFVGTLFAMILDGWFWLEPFNYKRYLEAFKNTLCDFIKFLLMGGGALAIILLFIYFMFKLWIW